MGPYKVLEVVYNGQTYRSKTEARWALSFDHLGISFQYEPSVASLHTPSGTINYCCDFFLPELQVWVEIKNQGTKTPLVEECRKAFLLAQQSGLPVYIFFGEPLGSKNLGRGNAYRYGPEGAVSRCHLFTQCPRCRSFRLRQYGLTPVACCAAAASSQAPPFANHSAPDLQRAALAAQAQRFHQLAF